MTKGRAALPATVVAEQDPLFIALGEPLAHDSSGRDDKGGRVGRPHHPPADGENRRLFWGALRSHQRTWAENDGAKPLSKLCLFVSPPLADEPKTNPLSPCHPGQAKRATRKCLLLPRWSTAAQKPRRRRRRAFYWIGLHQLRSRRIAFHSPCKSMA